MLFRIIRSDHMAILLCCPEYVNSIQFYLMDRNNKHSDVQVIPAMSHDVKNVKEKNVP